MKKKYKYNELSKVKCNVCNKPLKMNVIHKQKDANLCYICSRLEKGMTSRTKISKLIHTKVIDFKAEQQLNIKVYG